MADPSLLVGRVIEIPMGTPQKELAVVSAFNFDKNTYTVALASGKRKDVRYDKLLDDAEFLDNATAHQRLNQRGLKKVEAYGMYGFRAQNRINGRLILINDPNTIRRFGGASSNKTMVVKTAPSATGRMQVVTPSGAKRAIKVADVMSGKLVMHDPTVRANLLQRFATQQQQAQDRLAAKKRVDNIKGIKKKKTTALPHVKAQHREAFQKLEEQVQQKRAVRNRLLDERVFALNPLRSTIVTRNESKSLDNVDSSHDAKLEDLEKQILAIEKRQRGMMRVPEAALANHIAQKVEERDIDGLKRVYASEFENYAIQNAGKHLRGTAREHDRQEALRNALRAEREKVKQWANADVRNAIVQHLSKRLNAVGDDIRRLQKKLKQLANKEAGRRIRRNGIPTTTAGLANLKRKLSNASSYSRSRIKKEIEELESYLRRTRRVTKPLPPNRVFKNSPIKEAFGPFQRLSNDDNVLYKLHMHFAQQAKRRRMQTKKMLNAAGNGDNGVKKILIVQHAQKALPGLTKADQRLRVRLMNLAIRKPSFFVVRQGGLYLSRKAQDMIKELRANVLGEDAAYVASPVRELAKVRKLGDTKSLGYNLKYPVELEYRTTAADAAKKRKTETEDNSLTRNSAGAANVADGTTSVGAQRLGKILQRMGVHTGKPVGKILRGQPLSDAVAVLEALPGGNDMYTSRQRKLVRPVGMEEAAKRGYSEEFYSEKTSDIVRSKIVNAFIKALSYQMCGCELSNPGRKVLRSRATCDTRTPPDYDSVDSAQMVEFKKAEDLLLKRSYPLISATVPEYGKENAFTKAFYEVTDSDPAHLAQKYEANRDVIMKTVMPSIIAGIQQMMKKYGLLEMDLDPMRNERRTGNRGPQAATGGVSRSTENRAALARGDIANRRATSSRIMRLLLGNCEEGLDLLLEDDMLTLPEGGVANGNGAYRLLRYVHEQYGPMIGFNTGYNRVSYLKDVGISISFLFLNGVNGRQTTRDALYALYRMHQFCRYVYGNNAAWCEGAKYGGIYNRAIPLAKHGQQSRTPKQMLMMIVNGQLDEVDKYRYQVKNTRTMDSNKSDSALTRMICWLQEAASEPITVEKMRSFLGGAFQTLYKENNSEDNPLTYHPKLAQLIKTNPLSRALFYVRAHICLPVFLADPQLTALFSRTAVQYHMLISGGMSAKYTPNFVKSDVFKRLREATKNVGHVMMERDKLQQLIRNGERTANPTNAEKRLLERRRQELSVLEKKLQQVSSNLNSKTSLKDHFVSLADHFTEVLRDAEEKGRIQMNDVLTRKEVGEQAIKLLFDYTESVTGNQLSNVKLSFSNSSTTSKHTTSTELVFYTDVPKPKSKMTAREFRAWVTKAFKLHAVLPATARGCDTKSGDRNTKRRTGTEAQSCLLRKLPIKPWLIPRELRFTTVKPSQEAMRAWAQYLFDLHEWLPQNTSYKLKFKNGENDYRTRVLNERGKELNILDKRLRPNAFMNPADVLTNELKNHARNIFPTLRPMSPNARLLQKQPTDGSMSSSPRSRSPKSTRHKMPSKKAQSRSPKANDASSSNWVVLRTTKDGRCALHAVSQVLRRMDIVVNSKRDDAMIANMKHYFADATNMNKRIQHLVQTGNYQRSDVANPQLYQNYIKSKLPWIERVIVLEERNMKNAVSANRLTTEILLRSVESQYAQNYREREINALQSGSAVVFIHQSSLGSDHWIAAIPASRYTCSRE